VKVRVETAYGETVERIPAWVKWATQVRAPGPARRPRQHAPLPPKHAVALGSPQRAAARSLDVQPCAPPPSRPLPNPLPRACSAPPGTAGDARAP